VGRSYSLPFEKRDTKKPKTNKKNAAASSIIIADFYVNQFVNGDVISSKKKLKNTRKNE
jgi:hypothetical protein